MHIVHEPLAPLSPQPFRVPHVCLGSPSRSSLNAPTPKSSSSPSSRLLPDASERRLESGDRLFDAPRSIIGAVLGALAGAVGLKVWEGFVCHRGVSEGRGEGEGGEGGATAAAEEGEGREGETEVGEQQGKIQALEDQLAVRWWTLVKLLFGKQ